MNKWWWLFVIALLLIACSKVEDEPVAEEQGLFTGTIQSIDGDHAIVDAQVGGGRMDIVVDVSTYSGDVLLVGDRIEVTYSGGIMESDPAQVNVVSIVKQ